MAATTARFVFLGVIPRPFDLMVNGKIEVQYPIEEGGQIFYEGSLEFVKHFISTDPEKCKLVSLDALTAIVRDSEYRMNPVVFKPCKRVSKQVFVREDAEGNDVFETQFSWIEADVAAANAAAAAPEKSLKGSAMDTLKARMIALIGEEAWPEYLKAFKADVGRTQGAMSNDDIAELGNRVRAAEEAAKETQS